MSERMSKMNKAATMLGTEMGAQMPPDLTRMALVMMNGWTAIGGQMITYTQNSLRAGLTAADEMRQCQSPRDMVDAQIRFMRGHYERTLDEAREMSGLLARVSGETIDALIPPGPMPTP
jgi:hypothetical protein